LSDSSVVRVSPAASDISNKSASMTLSKECRSVLRMETVDL
jgi:hypothetical protein